MSGLPCRVKGEMMERKQFLRYMGAALGWVAIAPLLTACNASGDSTTATDTTLPPAAETTSPPATTPPPAITVTLSAEEVAGLKYMREEEKLAHDVYVALYARWGKNIFDQISLSETTHTEVILALLVKYGIDDPAAGNTAGVFTDPYLQMLYDTLIAMGSPTLIDALKVGALIEETDIRDIKVKKAVTDEADILTVYDSLLCGSQSHLRAFNSQLLGLGVIYVPQVITQAEWDAIVNSGTCVAM
jgi:hypothetical protein